MSNNPNPGKGDPNKPETPPGHEDDPGRGKEDAPGQQKPRPNQDLPDSGETPES